MSSIQKIGVLTSGGDAPGMNACLRAVARTAAFYGKETLGVRRGYDGLIDADFVPFGSEAVSDIIQRGGSILKSMRSARFRTPDGRQKAYENLKSAGMDALVVIGGDGTYAGAAAFLNEYPDLKIVGAPGTIDADLFGTDTTIGFDTAVNTALQAIDRLRDTANATGRLFFVEVMGRDAGFIALNAGISGGAEAVLIPETPTEFDALARLLERGWKRQKSSYIFVVAEGDESGGAYAAAKAIGERFDEYETRVCVLGHLQRGGSPTYFDRLLASRIGAETVEALLSGVSGLAIGLQDNRLIRVAFSLCVKEKAPVNPNLIRLVEMLSS